MLYHTIREIAPYDNFKFAGPCRECKGALQRVELIWDGVIAQYGIVPQGINAFGMCYKCQMDFQDQIESAEAAAGWNPNP